MLLFWLILASTAAAGAVHHEISPAQPTPGSMTTTISGEGTTSVVAARGKVSGDDHSELLAARASAVDAPHVSNATTDKDRLHAYTLVLKTGPAPGLAVPPVPTIVGGSSLVPPKKHTGVCSRGRSPSNYRANYVSVLEFRPPRKPALGATVIMRVRDVTPPPKKTLRHTTPQHAPFALLFVQP